MRGASSAEVTSAVAWAAGLASLSSRQLGLNTWGEAHKGRRRTWHKHALRIRNAHAALVITARYPTCLTAPVMTPKMAASTEMGSGHCGEHGVGDGRTGA